jgi:hypothetical protein
VKRIQRRREKGWRMPPNTVYVGRPSLWGNPWSSADIGRSYPEIPIGERAAAAARLYRRELEHWGLLTDYSEVVSRDRWEVTARTTGESGALNMAEYAAIALYGKDLACWCPLTQPCHADVLLELAARTSEVRGAG